MELHLKTLHVFLAGLFALFAAMCLSISLYLVGVQIRQGIESSKDKDLRIAESNEHAAWHTFRAARYTAINTTGQVELARTSIEKANKKALMAEYKMQAVCKKAKTRC